MLKLILSTLGLSTGETPHDSHGGCEKSYTIRLGKCVETDEVFAAWTSGSLKEMLRVIDSPTNLIDRHLLLMNIVSQAYKSRKEKRARETCRTIAEMHLAEFAAIAPALKEDLGGELPRVSTFQQYATLLTEDGEFERAIEVCEAALSYGLSDGTKGDYHGRIERIRKKISRRPTC